MTLTRFAELAEAYGGAVDRWPEAERVAAEALVAAEPVAAERILSEARRLDAVLAAAPAPKPGEAVRARALAAFEALRPETRGWRTWLASLGGVSLDPLGDGVLGGRNAIAAALTLTLALGAAVGYGGGRALVVEAERDLVLSQSIFGAADVFGVEG